MKNLQIIIGNEIHTSNQTTNLVIALHLSAMEHVFLIINGLILLMFK